MKGKVEKGAQSSGTAQRLRLQVEDIEDLQTTPGGSSIGGSSPIASAPPSPMREAAVVVEKERRLLSAPSDTALPGGKTQQEPARLVPGAGSVLHAGEDARSSSNTPGVEGEGFVMPRDYSGLPVGRQWRPAARIEELLLPSRHGSMKPHRAMLGVRVRHHVVPVDSRDIARMRQGKNVVHERMLDTPRQEMRKSGRSSIVVQLGDVAYDVHYLRDDTQLWHRRVPRTPSVLERMLCCDV